MSQVNDIKIIQFGEGNFLRGFVDWMVQKMNDQGLFNGKIAVVQPLENGLISMLKDQDYTYTHILKGLVKGEPIKNYYKNDTIATGINPYTSYEEFMNLAKIDTANIIVSNTTEAGITFDSDDVLDDSLNVTFPGKLTKLMYERFKYVNGDLDKGYMLLPCELIDHNADKLKEAILSYIELWNLGEAFKTWVLSGNTFCNTLVDRIVPGYPRDTIEDVWAMIGYKDNLVVESEQFNLWVIEGDERVQKAFPANEAGCNALFVDDVTPYKMRKVRILNGSHTALVPVGLLYGVETVKESMDNTVLSTFLNDAVNEEIIPTLTLPKDELDTFSKEVMERFQNPFVKHYLISIALNSMSKYRTRVLPSVTAYLEKYGVLPKRLITSLAAYIVLYRGSYNGYNFELKDDEGILTLFHDLWSAYDGSEAGIEHIVRSVLGYEKNWGYDLNNIEGLTDMTIQLVVDILDKGIEQVIA